MKKSLKTLIGTICLSTILSTNVLAVPNGTVVIGAKAYNLEYANAESNIAEISNSVVNSGGKIYIKSFSGEWIDNNTSETIDNKAIPEVIYKDGNGITKYAAADGEEIKDTEEKEIDNSIFEQEGIEKYITIDRIEVEGENIYHTFMGVEHYLPKTDLNPNLNKQIYNLLKAHLTNNERGNYTLTAYIKGDETRDFENIIGVSTCPSITERYANWRFYFEENKLANEEKAPIYMELAGLGDSTSEDFSYDEYYVDKLNKCLKAIFGQEEGQLIHEYVISEYKYMHSLAKDESIRSQFSTGKCAFRHEKQIGNITVITDFTRFLRLNFYFKFK